MAMRGAFLAPVLLPLPTGFINLPRAFVQSFLSGADAVAGSNVLELSWETIEGYVQRVCVGWVGGIARDSDVRSDLFEISAEFARCIGLQEHLLRSPQAFLGVHVVESLPIARQVNVDPCTEDDWELIQLHAGLLEGEFLRQMCVVNDRQVHPIWVHQNILIRIRVSLPVGMEFARVSPNTEVIVAPKERKPYCTSTTLDPEFYYPASPLLRVQKPLDNANISQDAAWVHPDTLAMLKGATQVTRGIPVVAIWDPTTSHDTTSSDRGAAQVADSLRKPLCGVATLRCSRAVGRDRVLISRAIASRLGVETHSPIRLRVLRLPELSPTKLVLKTLDSSIDSSIGHDVAEWIRALDHGLVLQNESLVTFFSTTRKQLTCVVEVEYEGRHIDDELIQQLQDVPVGALEKYTVLGGPNGFVPTPEIFTVSNASPTQQHILQSFKHLDNPKRQLDYSLQLLARDSPAYSKTLGAIRATMLREECAARVMLGVKPTGSVLLFGDRGSGKSTLLRSLGSYLEAEPSSLACPIVLECRSLRGLKMDTVKTRLSEAFERAKVNGPSLLLLDNLDALIPEENETAGQANEQSRRIAEHLVTLLQQNRERMWKTTLELNNCLKREVVQIKTKFTMPDEQQAAALSLFETMGVGMLRKSIQVVAAARSDASLHRTLKSCGLFDRPVQVMAPKAELRETIIRSLLKLKLSAATASVVNEVYLDPAIDYGYLASVTEGYSLRDLTNVSDRTLHQMFVRQARGTYSVDVERKLIQADVTQALEGFQPTALVGVDLFKSSVQWSDVGGLSSVRNVLKDTLELPTRYGKLYDRTPIKLPAGMLLYGPPGCGKTLLASAVASECGLNFISVKGPEVLNKYIGASEQAIRDLFARAASAAPSVLFLDEFDSIAPRRGADNTGVTDRLVNQLLTFLDGVESRKGVYVLAATSRPDMIDPALLRPGRLDKSLYCGFPNEAERIDILRAVGRNMEIDDEAFDYLHVIAQAPKSRLFSGADLQALMYSAQLELVHEKLDENASTSNVIMKRHLETAFNNTKPSTSESARRAYEASYATFSKSRNTDFSVADAGASANAEGLKSHVQHQRTALA